MSRGKFLTRTHSRCRVYIWPRKPGSVGGDAPESFGQVAGWLQAGFGPEFNADVPRSEQVLVAVIRAEFNADPARIQICADAGQVWGVDAGRVRRVDAPENLPTTSRKPPENLSIMSRKLHENNPQTFQRGFLKRRLPGELSTVFENHLRPFGA